MIGFSQSHSSAPSPARTTPASALPALEREALRAQVARSPPAGPACCASSSSAARERPLRTGGLLDTTTAPATDRAPRPGHAAAPPHHDRPRRTPARARTAGPQPAFGPDPSRPSRACSSRGRRSGRCRRVREPGSALTACPSRLSNRSWASSSGIHCDRTGRAPDSSSGTLGGRGRLIRMMWPGGTRRTCVKYVSSLAGQRLIR